MKSKNLSKQDREEILKAVRAKALAKWEASPLHKEMVGLEAEADKIIYDKQLEMIPGKDRKVLDKYGAYMGRKVICFAIDAESGKARSVWNEKNKNPKIVVRDYRGNFQRPTGYPVYGGDLSEIIEDENPDLLPRYCELWHLRECECDTAVMAFGKLLGQCHTTKQAYDNESLRPFLPDWMLTWQPSPKVAPAVEDSDAAIIAELSAVEAQQ